MNFREWFNQMFSGNVGDRELTMARAAGQDDGTRLVDAYCDAFETGVTSRLQTRLSKFRDLGIDSVKVAQTATQAGETNGVPAIGAIDDDDEEPRVFVPPPKPERASRRTASAK